MHFIRAVKCIHSIIHLSLYCPLSNCEVYSDSIPYSPPFLTLVTCTFSHSVWDFIVSSDLGNFCSLFLQILFYPPCVLWAPTPIKCVLGYCSPSIFFSSPFSLCLSFWKVFIAVSSSSFVFSSTKSSLLLIPSSGCIYLHHSHCGFYLQKFNLGLFLGLPDLANKNTRCKVILELQVSSK